MLKEIFLKKSRKVPLDLEGKQDINANFIKCMHANSFCCLSKGKLFTCTVAPNVRHFNKFFNKNIPITDVDYIDIYKAQNKEEVMLFFEQTYTVLQVLLSKKKNFWTSMAKIEKGHKKVGQSNNH